MSKCIAHYSMLRLCAGMYPNNLACIRSGENCAPALLPVQDFSHFININVGFNKTEIEFMYLHCWFFCSRNLMGNFVVNEKSTTTVTTSSTKYHNKEILLWCCYIVLKTKWEKNWPINCCHGVNFFSTFHFFSSFFFGLFALSNQCGHMNGSLILCCFLRSNSRSKFFWGWRIFAIIILVICTNHHLVLVTVVYELYVCTEADVHVHQQWFSTARLLLSIDHRPPMLVSLWGIQGLP